MKSNKRLRHLAIFGSLGLACVIGGSIVLSSCTGGSSGSAYAPYTILLNDLGSNNYQKFKFDTASRQAMFLDENNLFNKGNNKYISLAEMRNVYLTKSQENVKTKLNDTTNWTKFLTLHGSQNRGTNPKLEDVYGNNIPYFAAAIPIDDTLDNLLGAYNMTNLFGSVFTYASSFANTLINYFVTAYMPTFYSGDKTFSILDTSTENDLLDTNKTKFKNAKIASLVGAFSLPLGSGKNTYHLWPSSFSAKINTDDFPKNTPNSQSTLYDFNNLDLGAPNTPYGILTNNYNQTNKPTWKTFDLPISDIKLTYQFYKADKNGGSYVTFEEVNNHLTNEQKSSLQKLGVTNGQFSNGAFEITLPKMTFDMTPEFYGYKDPNYSGIIDIVSTGLFSIQPKKEWIGNNDILKNSYPTDLEAALSNSIKTNWRYLNTNYNDTNIPTNVWNQIKDKNRNDLPYYFSKLNTYFKNVENVAPFSVESPEPATTTSNFDGFNINQIIGLFNDPYNAKSNNLNDRVIANNKNSLNKWSYLRLWALGYLEDNKSNSTSIDSLQDYKDLKNKLMNGNLKDFMDRNNNNNKTYYEKFDKGRKVFNGFIKLSNTQVGTVINFDAKSKL